VIVVVTLTVESQIAVIADFIPEQLASSTGIAGFIGVWVIFTVTQYYILAHVKQSNKESRSRLRYFNTLHNIVTTAQLVLAAIIGLVILQILLWQEYNTSMLYAALSISYGLWIITLTLLARAFFSWYKFSKQNVMILLLAASMVAYVINGTLGLYIFIDGLAKQNSVIKSGDIAAFPEFSGATLADQILTVNQIAASVAFVLTWIGTVILLRPYIKKLGKIRFWAIMVTAMVYYLVSFPLFVLGFFTPSENSDAMTNILIFSLASLFTGIVFGAAFLSVARTVQTSSAVRRYMTIAAYGFLMFYVAGSATVSQTAYPPYGLASVSFTGLSCYLIFNGLYFSAISVSQDSALRKSIRKSVMEQSKLLDGIGTAQMEKEVQTRVLTVAKKTSNVMAEKTGVEETMMTEEDMKDYMNMVIKELESKR
jgi:hypothetical protein